VPFLDESPGFKVPPVKLYWWPVRSATCNW
jgi:hypothetical protein